MLSYKVFELSISNRLLLKYSFEILKKLLIFSRRQVQQQYYGQTENAQAFISEHVDAPFSLECTLLSVITLSNRFGHYSPSVQHMVSSGKGDQAAEQFQLRTYH
jgi:hypothetical protein